MFPLKDDNPTTTTAVCTVGLIVLNALVFVYQISLEAGSQDGARAAQAFISEFGLVPCRLTGACPSAADLPSPVLSIFTSMFLHGGLFHIAGNMLYLWIFGNNVEDTLGHVRFLIFYFASGVIAALAQTAIGPDSTVPMVGASGAISGVLGGYLLLYPRARILALVPLGFFMQLMEVPAVIVLGFWIFVQFFNAFLMPAHGGGGVAFFAHIGGFLAGMALVHILRVRERYRSWGKDW